MHATRNVTGWAKILAVALLGGSSLFTLGTGCEGDAGQLGSFTLPTEGAGAPLDSSDFDLQLEPTIVNGKWICCCC